MLGRSYTSDGGTFRYPSTWRVSTYNVVSSFSTLVAVVSNYPTHDPCVRGNGSISCSATQFGQLSPAGILVTWDIYGFPGYGIDKAPGMPTTIDGRLLGPRPDQEQRA